MFSSLLQILTNDRALRRRIATRKQLQTKQANKNEQESRTRASKESAAAGFASFAGQQGPYNGGLCFQQRENPRNCETETVGSEVNGSDHVPKRTLSMGQAHGTYVWARYDYLGPCGILAHPSLK